METETETVEVTSYKVNPRRHVHIHLREEGGYDIVHVYTDKLVPVEGLYDYDLPSNTTVRRVFKDLALVRIKSYLHTETVGCIAHFLTVKNDMETWAYMGKGGEA